MILEWLDSGVPVIEENLCRGCKKCQIEAACPMKAAKLKDGAIDIDPKICINCGRCSGKCPFGVNKNGIPGYMVYIGGRWGKKISHGRSLGKIFTEEEEVLSVVEKAILLFREQGIAGERFSDTIERIGFDKVKEQLLSDEILNRKQEILEMNSL